MPMFNTVSTDGQTDWKGFARTIAAQHIRVIGDMCHCGAQLGACRVRRLAEQYNVPLSDYAAH